MNLSVRLEQLHLQARLNLWMRLFTVFVRVALAAGFIMAGMVKVMGERFTDLSTFPPMGHYLYAFYRTGWYYTFVGVLQTLAGLLLLIPYTATLGAIIYFPIILNILMLSLSVRFEGSLLTAPLMVIANIYLFCWDYHKFRWLLPGQHRAVNKQLLKGHVTSKKFPFKFAAFVLAVMLAVAFTAMHAFSLYPRNTLQGCQNQCADSDKDPVACANFCNCIHVEGRPLDSCLNEYNKAMATKATKR